MIQNYSTSLITKTRSKYINFDIINRIKYIDTLLIWKPDTAEYDTYEVELESIQHRFYKFPK